MKTRVSEHFALEEFAVSAQYPELAEPVPEAFVPHVVVLAEKILEPIRAHFGKPIRINSGYRSARLNKAVGGSPTSQHRRAQAADFTIRGLGMQDVFVALLSREIKVPCGQCIWYPSRGFIHIALPSIKYPNPSFFVHEPEEGMKYERVLSERQLLELLDAADAQRVV